MAINCYVCRKSTCNHVHTLDELLEFRRNPKWTAEEMRLGLLELIEYSKLWG
jgi:hypothetical protein